MALVTALAIAAGAAPASAVEWITTTCSGPEAQNCVESVGVKASGAPDSSYVFDPEVRAVAQPYPTPLGDGWVVHLVRPGNARAGIGYGVPQCMAPPNTATFLDIPVNREALCRDLRAGIRTGGVQVASLEGKTVRVRLRVGGFVPRYGVVIGSKRGDLPEQTTPNRTWNYESAGGQNVLTMVLRPEPTDGLIENGAPCSVESGCEGGQANWRGIMTYAFIGDFAYFSQRDLAGGTTVFTNAFRYGGLNVDPNKRTLSVKLAGPHLRMDGSENEAFAGVFIPESLANSPEGFGLPTTDEQLQQALTAYRDGNPRTITAALTRNAAGAPNGVYAEATGIKFSSPTIELRGPERGSEKPATPAAPAAPGRPNAKMTLNKRKKVVVAAVAPVAGVTYAISASAKGSGKKAKVLKGKCTPNAKTKKVDCAIRLAKGRWTVSVTPTAGTTLGAPLTRSVTVR